MRENASGNTRLNLVISWLSRSLLRKQLCWLNGKDSRRFSGSGGTQNENSNRTTRTGEERSREGERRGKRLLLLTPGPTNQVSRKFSPSLLSSTPFPSQLPARFLQSRGYWITPYQWNCRGDPLPARSANDKLHVTVVVCQNCGRHGGERTLACRGKINRRRINTAHWC